MIEQAQYGVNKVDMQMFQLKKYENVKINLRLEIKT